MDGNFFLYGQLSFGLYSGVDLSYYAKLSVELADQKKVTNLYGREIFADFDLKKGKLPDDQNQFVIDDGDDDFLFVKPGNSLFNNSRAKYQEVKENGEDYNRLATLNNLLEALPSTDDVKNNRVLANDITDLSSALGDYISNLDSLSKKMNNNPDPDFQLIKSTASSGAYFHEKLKSFIDTYPEMMDKYSVFALAFSSMDKKKFTRRQDYLELAENLEKDRRAKLEEEKKNPVVEEPKKVAAPKNVEIKVEEPKKVDKIQPVQPQVQPAVQPKNPAGLRNFAAGLDENNTFVRALNQIDLMKTSLEADVRDKKPGLTYEEIVRRQAIIEWLETSLSKPAERQKWISNEQKYVDFVNNKLLKNDFTGYEKQFESTENGIKQVYDNFDLRKDCLVPESLKKYYRDPAQNPATEQKRLEEKNLLLQTNPEVVDLYLEDPVSGITDELKRAIMKDLDYPANLQLSQGRQNLTSYFDTDLNPDIKDLAEDYDRAGFLTSRPSAMASMFIQYLMGRSENAYSFEEASKVVPGSQNFDAEIAAFKAFCHDNVIRDKEVKQLINGKWTVVETIPVEQQQAQKGCKAWADIFFNSAKKLEEFKCPDIDYSDGKAIEEHGEFLMDFNLFIQDSLQNRDPYLRNNDDAFALVEGGKVSIMDKTRVIDTAQAYIQTFYNEYHSEKVLAVLNHQNSLSARLAVLAGRRAAFATLTRHMYAGKTLGECNKISVKSVLEKNCTILVTGQMSMDRTITKEMAIAYLKEKNPTLPEKALSLIQNVKDETRQTSFNENQKLIVDHARTKLTQDIQDGLKDRLEEVFTPGKTARQLYAEINSPAMNAASDAGASMVQRLLAGESQAELFQCVGGDSLSAIKINGKTLEETWGEKYDFIEDPVQKRKMYMAELANEAVRGNADITFDFYVLTAEDTVEKAGVIHVLDSTKTMEKQRRFFKNIRDVHTTAEGIQSSLIRHVPTKAETRELFDQMLKALNNCVLHSRLDTYDKKCTYSVLKADLDQYLNLAEQYYSRQESLMRDAGASAKELAALAEEKRTAFGHLKEYREELADYASRNRVVPSAHEYTVEQSTSYNFLSMKETFLKRALFRGKEIKIDETIAVIDGELNWVNSYNGDAILPEDKLNLLEEKYGFQIGTKYIREYRAKSGREIKEMEGFSDRILISDPSRIHSLFTLWAMANKNLSVTEAARLADVPVLDNDGNVTNQEQLDANKALRREFLEFAMAHPMVKAPADATPESEAERVKAWMDVFKKAKAKIEQYRIPDIDFEDAEEVKPYINELMELRCQSVEAVQEWNRLLESTTHENAARQIGSIKEFENVRQFYLDMQSSFGMSIMQGYVINPRPMPYEIRNAVCRRYDSGKLMNPFRNKTFAEFREARKTAIAHDDAYRTKIDKLLTEGKGPSNALAISYALGHNGAAFEEKMRELNDLADKAERESISRNIRSNISNFRTQCMTQEVRNAILASGDSVQEMQNLFARNVVVYGRNTTIGDHINRSLSLNLIQDFYGGALVIKGLSKSDVFLIGKEGKTPKEIWGEKYAGIESEDEKEFLYRLEVFKVLAKGEKTVKIRMFEPDGVNGLIETRPEIMVTPKAEMEKLLHDAASYMGERDLLLSELKEIRRQLISTQDKDKKDHNFFRTDVTGSTQYQNMCKALQNVITLLEKDVEGSAEEPVSGEQIRNGLSVLERESATYYKGHYGYFFRPITDNGGLRFNLSDKMQSGLVNRFDLMRKPLNKNIVCEKELFEKSDSTRILVNAKSAQKSLGLEYKGDDYYRNAVIKKELERKLEALKLTFSVQNMKSDKKELALAKSFLLGLFESYKNAPLEGPGSKKQDTEILRLTERFDEKAKELSKDSVFIKMMEANREDCIRRWMDIENKQEELHASYIEKYNNMFALNGNPANYAVGVFPDQNTTVENKLRSISPDNEGDDDREFFYTRAAEVMLLQVLCENTDTAKQYREQIAANPDFYNKLLDKATNYLKSDEAITDNNKIPLFASKINNKKFASAFFNQLKVDEKTLATQELTKNDTRLQSLENLFNPALFDDVNSFTYHTGDYYNPADRAFFLVASGSEPDLDTHDRNIFFNWTKGQYYKNLDNEVVQFETPNPEVFKKCGYEYKDKEEFEPRVTEINTPFIFYLMSEHQMSFEDALDTSMAWVMLESTDKEVDKARIAQRYRYEFYRFLEEHPVKDQTITADRAKENFEAWAKIYKDGYEKLMQGKLPVINYRNVDEIKKNFFRLASISRLITSANTEFGRIFDGTINGVNGLNIAKQACGGEMAFREIQNGIRMLSGQLKAFEQGYLQPERQHLTLSECGNTPREFRVNLLKIAAKRYFAGQDMNSMAGKSFGDISKTYSAMNLMKDEIVDEIGRKMETEPNVFPEGCDPDSAIRYMLGVDTKTFEVGMQKVIDEALKQIELKHYYHQFDTTSFNLTHLAPKENKGYVQLLQIPDDDVEGMRRFFTLVIPNFGTGEEFCESRLYSGAWGPFCRTHLDNCMEAGINPNELYLVSGKTFEERWGDKYADIEDPVEKEKLYRLEFLKAVAKGEEEIKQRVFKFENGRVTEDSLTIYIPSNAQKKQFFDAVHVYEQGRNNMLLELNNFKSRFSATQQVATRNFDNDNVVFATEGDKEYSRMTGRLNELIRGFSKDYQEDYTPEYFLQKFDLAMAAAREYERTHTSEKSPNEKTRRDLCKKLLQVLPRMKETYMRLRSGFELDLRIEPRITMKEASVNKIRPFVMTLNNRFGITKKTDLEYEKTFVRDEIKVRINRMMFRPVPDTENHLAIEGILLARKYLRLLYNKIADENLMKPEDLFSLDDKLISREEELSKNPVFINLMRTFGANNADRVLEAWEEYEKLDERIRQDSENKLDDMRRAYRTVPGYLVKLPNNRNDLKTDDWHKVIVNRIKEEYKANPQRVNSNVRLEDIYTNLAEILVHQMMAKNTQVGKILRSSFGVYADADKKNAIQKENIANVKAILVDNEILSAKKAEKAVKQLLSGRLCEDVEKIYLSELHYHFEKKEMKPDPDLDDSIMMERNEEPENQMEEKPENQQENNRDLNQEIGFGIDFGDIGDIGVGDEIPKRSIFMGADTENQRNLMFGRVYDNTVKNSEDDIFDDPFAENEEENMNIINTNQQPRKAFKITKDVFVKFMKDVAEDYQALNQMKEDGVNKNNAQELQDFNAEKAKHFGKLVIFKMAMDQKFVFKPGDTMKEAQEHALFGLPQFAEEHALKQKAFARIVAEHSPKQLAEIAEYRNFEELLSNTAKQIREEEKNPNRYPEDGLLINNGQGEKNTVKNEHQNGMGMK